MAYIDPDPKLSARRRTQMIQQQLRHRGIWQEQVLHVFDMVKRHEFVSEALYQRAYDDNPLPIGSSQTISQPYIVALMTQELHLEGHEKVLEIGTGSGYQTAILAELTEYVVSVERIEQLHYMAKHRLLLEQGYENIELILGNGLESPVLEKYRYERILVAAGAPSPPVFLMALLKPGGFMVIPIGDRHLQFLYRITRLGGHGYRPEGESRTDYPGYLFKRLSGCRFVPLVGPGGWQS